MSTYLCIHSPNVSEPIFSWVGRYQPLVWEQSEAPGSRELLYHIAFWWRGEFLTIFNISLHQAEWIPVPLTTGQVCKAFHSPTEGMAATSVNTASIPVCLFKKALSSATDPKDTLLRGAALSSKIFLHLSGCIPSWKPQESKAKVFTFQQLNLTGRIKCKQEKQRELPLKGQISAGWNHVLC